jgi:hypothetical protein
MALPTQVASHLTTDYSATLDPINGVSINSRRRQYNFGERIAELAPTESPFYVYLSKVAKKPTDDPVFKFLEQRHQWQRRYGILVDYKSVSGATPGELYVVSPYDKYGRKLYTEGETLSTTGANNDLTPQYFLAGQQISVLGTVGGSKAIRYFTVTEVASAECGSATCLFNSANATVTKLTVIPSQYVSGFTDYNSMTFDVPVTGAAMGQTYVNIIGSAFYEGSGAPTSWHDELWDREGFCQIFKTAIEMHSGTSESTRYRGISNEYARQWTEKLKEHKMDIENAVLFQTGGIFNDGTGIKRYTWGILPYIETYGKVYNFSYAASSQDSFTDAMQDFFAPESGNDGRKLVLASRKVINWMNKLGENGFLRNTVGSSAYNLDIENIKGRFGHKIMQVNTIFGELNYIQEPLLRNGYEDYAIAVDLNNVAIRPLSGNGKSRDTFIKTNIQDNDVDGRQDLITTETGLEISLPETHAILKWS